MFWVPNDSPVSGGVNRRWQGVAGRVLIMHEMSLTLVGPDSNGVVSSRLKSFETTYPDSSGCIFRVSTRDALT